MIDAIFPIIVLLVVVLAANATRETLWIRSLKRTPEATGLWLLHALYLTMSTLTISALYFASLAVVRFFFGPEATAGWGLPTIVAIIAMLAVPSLLGRELRRRRSEQESQRRFGGPRMRP